MFKYKTRGDKSPRGLQKVFFSCTKEDFAAFFDWTSKRILDIVDCAVWYYTSDEAYEDADTDLDGMCLFVVPITTKLLTTNNRTIRADLPFAESHHIPVLPLMMEQGLDELYRNHFGDRHYLDPYQSDSTAISFDEKLKSYILSVTVGDELAEKVRKAFDAYIFLSYRKKDRKYAQELMRLIHRNDFCRDIAIWYDEFLIPSEDFRTSIESVIEKSSLFSMVVTPNLVDEDNFIRREEYRMARAAGKPILPAEMAETDRFLLAEQYPGIGPVVKTTELSEALLDMLTDIATHGNDDDPEHCFFIGLAYLNGIDVEKDTEKAFSLIRYAAESGVIEAVSKLVNMYESGEGIARDYYTAIYWQERLCELCYEVANGNPNVDNCFRHLQELWHTAEKLKLVHDFQKSEDYYKKLVEFSTRYSTLFPYYPNIDRLVQIGEQGIGDILSALGRWDKAEPHFHNALENMEKHANYYNTPIVWHDLGLILHRLGWSRLNAGDLNEAEKYFKRENDLYKEIVKSYDMISIRRDYAISFRNLGKACFEKNDYVQAKEYYSRAVEALEQIAKETNTEEKSSILAETYRMLGDVYRGEYQLDKAKKLYQKSYEITQSLVLETNMYYALRNHSVSCIKCGDVCFAHDEDAAAQSYFEEAKAILERFQNHSKSDDIARDWLICIERLGDCSLKAHEYEKAESYYQRSLEVCAKRENELGSIAAVRDVAIPLIVIGDIKKAQGDNSAALNYYLRAKAKFDIIKGKVEIVIPSIRRDTALLLEKIGNEYSDEKKSKDAESAYLEALEEFRILREETDSTNARRDLTRILEKVGDMQSNLENWNGAEASYSAALEDLRGLKDGTDSLAVLCPLVSLLEKLGNIRHDIGDDEDAGKCFEEGAEAFRKLADITGAAGDKRGTAYCLLMLGETKAKRDPDGAYQCMQEACKEFKKLTEAYYEQWSYEDLAKSCYRLAVIRKPYDIDSLREAYSLFEQLYQWFPYTGEYKYYKDEITALLRSAIGFRKP